MSSLVLGAGLCWTACSTPTYQRTNVDLPRDASSADRRDTAAVAEVSPSDLVDRPSDLAPDVAQERASDLPSESSEPGISPSAEPMTEAGVGVVLDARLDTRPDAGTPMDAYAERPPVDAPVASATISIDFAGTSEKLASSDVAGVVAAANWNTAANSSTSVDGSSGILTGLLRSDGTPSGASVTWMGTSAIAVLSTVMAIDPDRKMMRSYVQSCYPASQPPDGGSAALLVSITSLPEPFVSRGFDLYVYSEQEIPSDDVRTWSIAAGNAAPINVSASPPSGSNPQFGGTYAEVTSAQGDYLRFNNLRGSSVTIKATPLTAKRNYCSAINGVQLVSH